jgi:hypothetical protein
LRYPYFRPAGLRIIISRRSAGIPGNHWLIG